MNFFADAVNRLFSEAFVKEVPRFLQDYQFIEEFHGVQVKAAVNSPSVAEYQKRYNDGKQRCFFLESSAWPRSVG